MRKQISTIKHQEIYHEALRDSFHIIILHSSWILHWYRHITSARNTSWPRAGTRSFWISRCNGNRSSFSINGEARYYAYRMSSSHMGFHVLWLVIPIIKNYPQTPADRRHLVNCRGWSWGFGKELVNFSDEGYHKTIVLIMVNGHKTVVSHYQPDVTILLLSGCGSDFLVLYWGAVLTCKDFTTWTGKEAPLRSAKHGLDAALALANRYSGRSFGTNFNLLDLFGALWIHACTLSARSAKWA